MTPHWWEKKKRLQVSPIGDEKRSLELIPIGVKWPTISNEKKLIRVTPLDMKKIHLSDFTLMGCEKTFLLKGPIAKFYLSHELTSLVGEKKTLDLTPFAWVIGG